MEDVATTTDEQQFDTVLDAARHGDTGRLQALLEQSPRLRDASIDFQNVPLMCLAACGGHIGAMQLLLAHGCSLEGRDYGHIPGPVKTPFLAAAKAGQTAAAVWLLEQGADVNDSGGAMMMSCQALDAGWPEEQHKQVIYGGQDGYWNDSDWTALMHAADDGNTALTAALLWRGASPSRRSRFGVSAPDLAQAGEVDVPQEAAAYCTVQRLLAWAGAAGEDVPCEDVGAIASLLGEAMQFAPPALKERCRTLALCMHRQGVPHDAVDAVLGALLVVAMRCQSS